MQGLAMEKTGQCRQARSTHLLVQHLKLPAHKRIIVGVDISGYEAAGRDEGGARTDNTVEEMREDQ
jgi:hypothetical protein